MNIFKKEENVRMMLNEIFKASLYSNPFDKDLLEKQIAGEKIRFELSCESEQVRYLEDLLSTFKITNEYKNLKVVECMMSLQEYDKKFKDKAFDKLQEVSKTVYNHYKKLTRQERKVFDDMYRETLLVVKGYMSKGVFNITSEQVDICIEILDSMHHLENTDIAINSNALLEQLAVIRSLHLSLKKGSETDQDWTNHLHQKLDKLKQMEDEL